MIGRFEHMKDFLRKLVTDHFDETRQTVLENEELLENFRKITHYPHGQFFSSPLDALAYLQEDVFPSFTRT